MDIDPATIQRNYGTAAEESRDDERTDPRVKAASQQRAELNSWIFRTIAIALLLVLTVWVLGDLFLRDDIGRQPSRPGKKITHIASLGSSFAAGPGIPPQVEPVAGQSGVNYARLLTTALNTSNNGNAGPVNLTDLSVSGATLLNLISEPQHWQGRVYAPQIDDLPSDADLVLVLGGGNDLDYIGGLMRESAAAGWVAWDAEGEEERWAPRLQELKSAEALARRYAVVLDVIHDAAPHAAVLVIEYLTLLGDDFIPGRHAPFDGDRTAHHRHVAEMLLNGTAQAVEGREGWCHIVEAGRLSTGHGVGSETPWVSDFQGISVLSGVPYHPNAAGMQAIEHMIVQKMIDLGLIDDGGEL
ncbi:SGNH hydrolase-type esterase domain-containing protein [Xylariaceae sp. FL0016]|nr:SGNH hydrolase-type esterase domain-containing protein [Xylariaceae sp. FL0016]